jgi:hypothetical protein
MLNFLSSKSLKLMTDFLPLSYQMTNHRVANYLSFYLSYRGKHLYHCPDILSHTTLGNIFTGKQDLSIPFNPEDYSIEHILARHLLTIHFMEHVVDEKGAMRLYGGMRRLQEIEKHDLVEDFIGSRCVFSR